MSQDQAHGLPISTGVASGEGKAPAEFVDAPQDDLNSLLAQEQTEIMSAEAATSRAGFEGHRGEAVRVRQLVDLTPYPDRAPHDFHRDPAIAPSEWDKDFEALRRRVGQNENLLVPDPFRAGAPCDSLPTGQTGHTTLTAGIKLQSSGGGEGGCENTDRVFEPLAPLSDADMLEMIKFGIVRAPIDSYRLDAGSFRYSSLNEAIAQAKRQLP